MKEKVCSGCKKSLPYDNFFVDNSRKDGRGRMCRDCKVLYNEQRRKVRREYVRDYLLSHPCVDCGESRLTVLDFDHQRDKKIHIGVIVSNGGSMKTLKEEIAKCEVRCANCHVHRHRSMLPHHKEDV